MLYSELQCSEAIHKAVERMGFAEMTEVQEKTIPVMLAGRDVIAKAPTGTGKTCAFGIPVADKPDSMEICFIPDGDYAAWLERRGFSTPEGNFVDKEGKVLGRHRGIHCYTLGQGRGLGVSGPHRYYVTALRPDTNEVVLSDGSDLGRDEVRGTEPNWLAVDSLTGPMEVTVRLRHSKTQLAATLEPEGDGVLLRMHTPARAPTPGQLAVFYDGDAVVGSAWIV